MSRKGTARNVCIDDIVADRTWEAWSLESATELMHYNNNNKKNQCVHIYGVDSQNAWLVPWKQGVETYPR